MEENFDGDLGNPNVLGDLTDSHVNQGRRWLNKSPFVLGQAGCLVRRGCHG